jgi:phosphatidylglycerophosphate synthase
MTGTTTTTTTNQDTTHFDVNYETIHDTFYLYIQEDQHRSSIQSNNTTRNRQFIQFVTFSILLFLFLVWYTIVPFVLWFLLPYQWDNTLFRILGLSSQQPWIVEWINMTIPKCLTILLTIHMIHGWMYIAWEQLKTKKYQSSATKRTYKKEV